MANKQSPLRQYFKDLWNGIITTWQGMTLTGWYLFKPKVTMRYPEEKPVIPPSHRGLHIYEENKCALCLGCVAACPVDCISIEALGKGKNRLILKFDIDYSKCLFCNLCCEACRPACLHLGPDYDLSSTTREGCVLHLARVKTEEEIEAHKKMLAAREAERKAKAEAYQKELEKEAEKEKDK